MRLKITDDTYECIITNLDRNEFSIDDIKDLYNKRWGIETSLKEAKYALELNALHSKKRKLIQQEKYGQDMMAINGRGPTCLSMVASYLKQDPTLHPYAIAQYAYDNGYYNGGISWTLMNEGVRHLGLQVQELPLNE